MLQVIVSVHAIQQQPAIVVGPVQGKCLFKGFPGFFHVATAKIAKADYIIGVGHVLSGKVLIINHEFRIGYSIIADSVKEHFQFLFKHGNILFMIQLCLVEQPVLHDYKYTPNKYRIGQDAEHSNHKYDPLCYALTVKPVF